MSISQDHFTLGTRQPVARAVCLELSIDVSAADFLASRPYILRRAVLKVNYSDNALAFEKASRGLHKILSLIHQEQLRNFLAERRITWKFTSERASWWNRARERLIHSVKIALRNIIGRSSMNFEEVAKALIEVEAIANSRPLTSINSRADEPAAISPCHLLIGQTLTVMPELPLIISMSAIMNCQQTLQRCKYCHKMTECFWQCCQFSFCCCSQHTINRLWF